MIAVITAQGEFNMTKLQETAAKLQGTEAAQEPAATQKPRVGAPARHLAPSKEKRPKRVPRAKKARGAGSAKPTKKGAHARRGSKTAKVVQLLKRPGGATGPDLMKATGWQAHSVRGFISGVLGRRMGLNVKSEVNRGQRRYSVEA